MEDELGYWVACLIDFEQALEGEMQMESPNDNTLRFLKYEITSCEQKIEELKNV